MLTKVEAVCFYTDKWNTQRLIRNQYVFLEAVNLANRNLSGALSYLLYVTPRSKRSSTTNNVDLTAANGCESPECR